jgi:DNA-binding response OmpR family regulator
MNRKCLIIDDDIDMRDGLAELLRDEGCAVDTASDAETGFQKLKNEKYDITLLDIKLPKIDGVEFLEQIKGNANTGRVFLVSGNPEAQKKLETAGLAGEVSGIIGKPFSIEEMIEKIKEAIDG